MELVVHISLENLFSPAGCRHVLGICEVVVSTINYYTRFEVSVYGGFVFILHLDHGWGHG